VSFAVSPPLAGPTSEGLTNPIQQKGNSHSGCCPSATYLCQPKIGDSVGVEHPGPEDLRRGGASAFGRAY